MIHLLGGGVRNGDLPLVHRRSTVHVAQACFHADNVRDVRSIVFVVLVACGSAQEKSQEPVTLPTSPSASASTSAATAREQGPAAQIQDIIPHWLDLLARGEDEKFIDEVVVPEQLGEVLGNRTKAELVDDFKRDKRKDVVKILTYVRTAKPDEVREDGGRTYVKYEGRDQVRHVTFVIEGAHVWIKN